MAYPSEEAMMSPSEETMTPSPSPWYFSDLTCSPSVSSEMSTQTPPRSAPVRSLYERVAETIIFFCVMSSYGAVKDSPLVLTAC